MGSCAASQAAGGTSKGEQWVMQGAVVSVLVTMTGNLALPVHLAETALGIKQIAGRGPHSSVFLQFSGKPFSQAVWFYKYILEFVLVSKVSTLSRYILRVVCHI